MKVKLIIGYVRKSIVNIRNIWRINISKKYKNLWKQSEFIIID